MNKKLIIAHGGGMIDNYQYTNCLEAIKHSYKLGYYYVEIDFELTTDKKLVCCHDWQLAKKITNSKWMIASYQQWMKNTIYHQYTTLDIISLVKLMKELPNLIIITDTKYLDKKNVDLQFAQIINGCKTIDHHILKRFIVQIYHPKMLKWIKAFYDFPIIYTLYQTTQNREEIVKSLKQYSNIETVTMSNTLFSQNKQLVNEIKNLGRKIYVHGDLIENFYLDNINNNLIDGFYLNNLEIIKTN